MMIALMNEVAGLRRRVTETPALCSSSELDLFARSMQNVSDADVLLNAIPRSERKLRAVLAAAYFDGGLVGFGRYLRSRSDAEDIFLIDDLLSDAVIQVRDGTLLSILEQNADDDDAADKLAKIREQLSTDEIAALSRETYDPTFLLFELSRAPSRRLIWQLKQFGAVEQVVAAVASLSQTPEFALACARVMQQFFGRDCSILGILEMSWPDGLDDWITFGNLVADLALKVKDGNLLSIIPSEARSALGQKRFETFLRYVAERL